MKRVKENRKTPWPLKYSHEFTHFMLVTRHKDMYVKHDIS